MEQSRAYRVRFGAGGIVLLLGAVVLSPQNPASAAEANKGDTAVSAPGDPGGNSAAASPSATMPVVMRGTRPAVPKPSPIANGEPAAAGRNDGFQRSLPSGSGWNNELNWEGINSENQADTVTR